MQPSAFVSHYDRHDTSKKKCRLSFHSFCFSFTYVDFFFYNYISSSLYHYFSAQTHHARSPVTSTLPSTGVTLSKTLAESNLRSSLFSAGRFTAHP